MTTDKTCNSCDEKDCGAHGKRPGEREEDYYERQVLASRMCRIKHKVMVLSGKGGVGKSTVAANLAVGLALAGKRVGVLDVDIHGPSIPKLFRLEGQQVSSEGEVLLPMEVSCGSGAVYVMSIAFFLRERDDAVIWRGPRKYGVIKQFLKDVDWGELDYLVIDAPPGTGDEPLAVAQLIDKADGAVVVTTPQELAVQDVRRCVVFCRQLELPVLGVVENMSGFACPKCGELVQIFGADGGRRMAEEMSVPYLGAIPIEPEVVVSGDLGDPIVRARPHSETAKAFGRIVRSLLEAEAKLASAEPPGPDEAGAMKIAVPMTEGVLASHFGHCEQFVVFEVDGDPKTILRQETHTPPPHEPGMLPQWLGDLGVTLVIAGNMGSRAQTLFAQRGIRTVIGATSQAPELIVQDYLSGQLQVGDNTCDH